MKDLGTFPDGGTPETVQKLNFGHIHPHCRSPIHEPNGDSWEIAQRMVRLKSPYLVKSASSGTCRSC